jgi:hypothetical protein
MNYSTLPFDLNLPNHPILLDVHALSARFQTVTDCRAARGKRYPLAVILTITMCAVPRCPIPPHGAAFWVALSIPRR